MIVRPDQEWLEKAGQLIRQGELVAFPTETVYGLGANALDANAVARIFKAKGRPLASPLIVHVADESMARSVTAEWPAHAAQLARRFWPGPLTLVIRKAPVVPDLVTAGLDSVGVRVPAHPVALALIRLAGVPIAAPSANRFTELSPTSAAHVADHLGDRVPLILDGGPSRVGIESTVASLRRVPPCILRPGMISQQDLEETTGFGWDLEVNRPHLSGPAESPGLHHRHYAPRTPLVVLEPGEPVPAGRGRVLEMPTDPQAYASYLYEALHAADREGWAWIALNQPPDTPAWSGIRDRLRRACTHPNDQLTEST